MTGVTGMKTSSSYRLNEPNILIREDKRLKDQAKIFFSSEKSVLSKIFGSRKKVILDAGCGNGAYLNLVRGEFKKCEYVGFDRNKDLLAHARNSFPDVVFKACDLTNGSEVHKELSSCSIDHVLLRFVLQHMSSSEVKTVLRNLRKSLKSGASLIVIEDDTLSFSTQPPCYGAAFLFNRLNSIVESRGGSRAVGASLPLVAKSCGYASVRQLRCSVGSDVLGWRDIRDMYIPLLSARVSAGGASFEETQLEVFDSWLSEASRDSSYVFRHNLLFTVCRV